MQIRAERRPPRQQELGSMPLIPEDLPFSVEAWISGEVELEEALGRTATLVLAQSLFAAACERDRRVIMLRHRPGR
jgi:hypothetical protein